MKVVEVKGHPGNVVCGSEAIGRGTRLPHGLGPTDRPMLTPHPEFQSSPGASWVRDCCRLWRRSTRRSAAVSRRSSRMAWSPPVWVILGRRWSRIRSTERVNASCGVAATCAVSMPVLAELEQCQPRRRVRVTLVHQERMRGSYDGTPGVGVSWHAWRNLLESAGSYLAWSDYCNPQPAVRNPQFGSRTSGPAAVPSHDATCFQQDPMIRFW
jgi:hypothetical protein